MRILICINGKVVNKKKDSKILESFLNNGELFVLVF